MILISNRIYAGRTSESFGCGDGKRGAMGQLQHWFASGGDDHNATERSWAPISIYRQLTRGGGFTNRIINQPRLRPSRVTWVVSGRRRVRYKRDRPNEPLGMIIANGDLIVRSPLDTTPRHVAVEPQLHSLPTTQSVRHRIVLT